MCWLTGYENMSNEMRLRIKELNAIGLKAERV